MLLSTLYLKKLVLVELSGLAGGEWRGGVVVFALRTACCIALITSRVCEGALCISCVNLNIEVADNPTWGRNEFKFEALS